MVTKNVGAEELVAHYLRSRGYTGALESFIREAGLPARVGQDLDQSWTLERILQEKRLYDLTVNFEDSSLADASAIWKEPFPKNIEQVHLDPSSNILQIQEIVVESRDSTNVERGLLVSTAARQLYKVEFSKTSSQQCTALNVAPDSPVLSFVILSHRYIIFTTISGSITLFDTFTESVVDKRKDHQKYAVQVILARHNNQTYIATAGWDSRVLLYTIADDAIRLSEPVASIQMSSVPESIIFAINEHSDDALYLIIGRRDSTHLHYYHVPPDIAKSSSSTPESTLVLSGKQNLAPYATTWNAFSPAYIATCPTDPTLLAIATNSTPHMKVLLVRMLFPQEQTSSHPPILNDSAALPPQQQTADPREVAAVLAHTNTNISQTRFSTPVIAWRPDGSGFWANSEEGTIKGIDRSGKIQATLQGHEYATKVRCLWAGVINSDEGGHGQDEEVLVSGGFDQKLLVWRLGSLAT